MIHKRLKNYKFLYFEDPDHELQEIKCNFFKAEIKRVHTIDDLYHELETALFDIFICYHLPPKIDGFSALKVAQSRDPLLPIIVMADGDDVGLFYDLIEKGADDVLPMSLINRLPLVAIRAYRDKFSLKKKKQEYDRSEDYEHTLRNITKSIPGMVYQYKLYPDGKQGFTFVSQGSYKLIGMTEEQLKSNFSLAWSRIHPEDVESVFHSIAEAAKNRSLWRQEFRIIDLDGKLKWLQGESVPEEELADDGSLVRNGMIMDITAQKEAEEQVIWLQKMESMGRLAGGIAHDFNNQLFIILGNCHYLLKKLDSEEDKEVVNEILQAVNRSKDLTNKLLALGRRQVLKPRVINLNKLIESLQSMFARLCGDKIEFQTDFDEDLHPVKVDPASIEHVLTNLVINAKDAMPDGGRVTIRTKNFKSHTQPKDFQEEGEWVVVSIEDTGSGISQDILPHIFEPFFTTKGFGKGTGMGLSACYGIIKQAGGHIRVRTHVNQGTTFLLYFQRSFQQAEEIKTSGSRTELPHGTETVLVVEDEPKVLEILVTNLKNLGYHVLKACDGLTALAEAKQYDGGKIHLLISDIVMPNMTGVDLAKKFRKIWPDSKIILISGHAGFDYLKKGLSRDDFEFLSKPFSPRDLACKVRDTLESKRR